MFREQDAIILERQPSIAVYRNGRDHVVVRAEPLDGADEDSFIFLATDDAVKALIAALQRQLKSGRHGYARHSPPAPGQSKGRGARRAGWRAQNMTLSVLVFPLDRRIGKVRDVAKKMLAKSTDRHAAFNRDQVTDALRTQLERIGLSEAERHEQLASFWEKVQAEMIRQTYRGSRPGGNAA